MERRLCAPASSWDPLLNRCISFKTMGLSPSEGPPPVLKPVLSTRGLDESWAAVSPSLWVSVGVAASGSLMVLLLLWFIIYRRHCRTSQSAGEKDSTPVEQEEETLSPRTHCNGQTQEVPIREGACGRGLCEGRAGHGLPLPATELGDSALVTAKTGQPAEV